MFVLSIDVNPTTWAPVRSGVPQGTILEPILFTIYVNDLPSVVNFNSQCLMFVDDTKLYRSVHLDSNAATSAIRRP